MTAEVTASISEYDHAELLAAPRRSTVKLRTLLWAMLSPDGAVLSAFGRRAYDSLCRAEEAALRCGFVVEHGARELSDGPTRRIRQRWTSPWREGIRALADTVGDFSNRLYVLRWLTDPAHGDLMADIYERVTDPALLALLPPVPDCKGQPDRVLTDWAIAALDVLERYDESAPRPMT